jgi:pimeloyl-ACP methyl ester carboxylesterase
MTTEEQVYFADNGAGWRLALKRVAAPGKPRGRPVVIVPGYGMNAFIFGFHPTGPSMEEHLASRGLEVWSVELRGQGRTLHEGGSMRFGLAELAVDDLRVALAGVLERTRTGASEVDVVGCSLGASLMFAHVACVPDAPVRALVSLGGLVTWVKVHPLLRAAFFSPKLVEHVELKGTRDLARAVLPILARRAPWALSIYMHAHTTDISRANEMVQTVENPNPWVNRDIAHWVKSRDLIVRGTNVSERVRRLENPFLCVVAMHDGIVPPETARWAYDAIASRDKQLVEVGDRREPAAHADLFIAYSAPAKVFEPLARFLLDRSR